MGNIPPSKRCLKSYPLLAFVFHRSGHTALIQPLCNAQDGKTVLKHSENHGYDLSCIVIHHQTVFILCGFLVAIRSERANIFTFPALHFQVGSDFYRYIPAVNVVYQILKRQCDSIRSTSRCQTVITVIDGNIADAQGRENLLQIISCLNVVSGKPAQILADCTVNFAGAHILKHPLKSRTLHVGSAVTVIFIVNLHQFQVWMAGDVLHANGLLTGYGIAFSVFVVLTGKSRIDSRSINLFWHNKNLQSFQCITTERRRLILL